MNIPSEFKGKLYFYWWTEYKTIVIHRNPFEGSQYVFLGSTEEIHVKFEDPRAAMAESLKASLEKERAESRRRQEIILGRIQECLALEVSS